jgi:hypothetical protein
MIREREKLGRPAAMNYAALRHYVENNSQLSSTTPESQVTGLESTPAISDLCRDRAQCVANYLQLVDRGRSDYLEPLNSFGLMLKGKEHLTGTGIVNLSPLR